jgi:hypothetical protein
VSALGVLRVAQPQKREEEQPHGDTIEARVEMCDGRPVDFAKDVDAVLAGDACENAGPARHCNGRVELTEVAERQRGQAVVLEHSSLVDPKRVDEDFGEHDEEHEEGREAKPLEKLEVEAQSDAVVHERALRPFTAWITVALAEVAAAATLSHTSVPGAVADEIGAVPA